MIPRLNFKIHWFMVGVMSPERMYELMTDIRHKDGVVGVVTGGPPKIRKKRRPLKKHKAKGARR